MLRENDKVWIEQIRQRPNNRGKNSSAQKDRRIRENGKKSVGDLAYLAEKLSEDQVWQVFTKERVEALVIALLGRGKTRSQPPTSQQLALAEMLIMRVSSELSGRPGIEGEWQLLRSAVENRLKSVEPILVAAAIDGAKQGVK